MNERMLYALEQADTRQERLEELRAAAPRCACPRPWPVPSIEEEERCALCGREVAED